VGRSGSGRGLDSFGSETLPPGEIAAESYSIVRFEQRSRSRCELYYMRMPLIGANGSGAGSPKI
jgi:hypothetical protein